MRLPLGSAPTSGVRGSLSKHSRKLVVQVRPTLPNPLHPSNNGDPAVVHSALEQFKPTLAHHSTVDLDAPRALNWFGRTGSGTTETNTVAPSLCLNTGRGSGLVVRPLGPVTYPDPSEREAMRLPLEGPWKPPPQGISTTGERRRPCRLGRTRHLGTSRGRRHPSLELRNIFDR